MQNLPVHRARGIQRYRDHSQNLRTQFQRIIKKAGVEPWPKLWQNLRATRVTELIDDFSEHLVVQWLGHSVKVAREHYLQVTEEHIDRAVMGELAYSKSASESASVPSGLGVNRPAQRFRSNSVSVDGARRNTHTQERAGVLDARERTRTSTGFYSHQHLKLTRLPIPPLALRSLKV